MLIWLKAAGIRAAKTFAQAALSILVVSQVTDIMQINWWEIISVGLIAAVISLLTSLKGLPETSTDGELNIKTSAKTGKITYDLALNDDLEKLAEKLTVSFKVVK